MPQRASRWSLYLRTADGASGVPLQPRSSDAAAAGSGEEVHGEVHALHGALHALWRDLHATLKVSCCCGKATWVMYVLGCMEYCMYGLAGALLSCLHPCMHR